MVPVNMSKGIQMNYPMNTNIMNQMQQPIQPFLGFNQNEEDDPDPILDDDYTDLNIINPLILMENTSLKKYV